MKTYTIGEAIHKFGKKTDIAYNTKSGAFIFVDEDNFIAVAYPYGKIKGYIELMIVDKQDEDVRDFIFLDELVVGEDDDMITKVDRAISLYIKNFTTKSNTIDESVSFTNKVINIINTLQNIKGER